MFPRLHRPACVTLRYLLAWALDQNPTKHTVYIDSELDAGVIRVCCDQLQREGHGPDVIVSVVVGAAPKLRGRRVDVWKGELLPTPAPVS